MASFLESLKTKAGDLFEKIPLIATEAKEDVKEFFTPDADPDVTVGEFLREVPGATGEVAKEIAQGTLRSLDFLGRKLLPGDELKDVPTPVQAKIEDFLFGGREKRAGGLAEVGEIELGIDPEKHPLLAPIFGAGIVGLDVIPGMQGKSKGLKQLFKSMTDDVVETFAKTSDKELIERTLRESAPKLTDKEVVKLTDDIAGVGTKAKVFEVVTGTKPPKPKAPVKAVDKVVDRGITATKAKKKALTDVAKKGTDSAFYKEAIERNDVDLIEQFDEVLPTKPISKVDKAPELVQQPLRSTKEIQQSIDDSMLERSFLEDAIDQDPSSSLIKFMGKGDDTLAEVQIRGERGGRKAGGLDDIVTELGFADLDEAQVAVDRYKANRVRLAEMKDDIRTLRIDLKDSRTRNVADMVPETNRKEIAKGLDAVETDIKSSLSPRRMNDMRQAGISEDVFAHALYSKAGGRMTHDEAGELAENLRAPIQDLLEKSPRQFELSRPKIESYSQELQGYFDHVVKKLKAQALAHPKDKGLQDQYTRASGQYIKARATLEALISEAGRIVEGSKVIGKYSRLPGMDGKIRKVREQIVKFADENPDKHANLPAEFDMAIESVNVNDATELLDFLTQWNRSSFLQKLSEFQKASMLSGISTHAVNTLGNFIQQVLDVPTRALAGGLDIVRAGVTRTPREVFAGEAKHQVRGALRAMPDAMTRAWKALGNEHFAQELRRTEIEAGTVVPAIRGQFGKIVRLPFRLLQSADLAFRTVKTGAESEAMAFRIGKLEGLKGKALKDRVAELEINLPADMLDMVDARVERSLMLENLTGMLKTIEDAKNKHPSAQFVIPFYRTLVNLSREAYRMTPIGGAGRTLGKIIPGKTGRAIERGFASKWTRNSHTRMEELSRQILGTSIMTMVVMKMLDGEIEITGSAPSKAGDRDIFYGTGKQPHSIRIGDNWVPFAKIQPIGQLIQIGAGISGMIEAHRNTGGLNEEEVGRETTKAVGDIISMVFTQSPFTGLGDFMNLLKGGQYNEGYPSAMNRYLGQLAGTFIPNIIRRYTVGIDPVIYEKRDISSQLRSRFPGLEDTLTPKRTLFGEKVKKDGTFLTRFLSPIEPSPVEENKIYEEFEKIGYTPSIPGRKAFGQKLSVEEYEILQLYFGTDLRVELTDMMATPRYQRQNDAIKHKILDKLSSSLLKRAQGVLFPSYRSRKAQSDKLILQGFVTREKVLSAEGKAILDQKFPVTPEESVTYARSVLQDGLKSGDVQPTIGDLLNQ